MVNKKPSTGCKACRDRHIKCDETRPGCKRCALKKIDCPGYRDVGGIIFVNRTEEITTRHAKRNKSPNMGQEKQLVSKSSPTASLQVSTDAIAIAFFFSQYGSSANRGMLTSRAHMEYLVPLFSKAKPDSALALATAAMAYQALGLFEGSETHKARQTKYMANACQRLQEAVTHPKESLENETLMAVLCLDFAEHLLSRESSRAACRAHVDGAAALIKHRPADSFKSEISRSLFAATRSNVLLQALWFGDAKGVIEFPKIDIGSMAPAIDQQHTLVRALTLEHDLMTNPQVSAAEREARKHLAAKMELELEDWWSRMPSAWQATVLRPMSKSTRTVHMIQAANIIGQWHCLKVLVLKLVCATTDEAAIREIIPLEVELTLQRLCLVCDYLTEEGISEIEDMEAVEKTMDRTASSVVVVSRGGPSIDVGKTANAKNYHINILRWILDELHEPRPYGAENFAYPSVSSKRLDDQWLQVLLTFTQKT